MRRAGPFSRLTVAPFLPVFAREKRHATYLGRPFHPDRRGGARAAPGRCQGPKGRGEERRQDGTETPPEELGEITSQFNKDFTEAVTAFRTAKDDKTRDEAKNKAFKLPETYAAKMIAFAEKHPNDPAAVDALVWVCVVPTSRGLPIEQKMLMLVRDKSKSDVVKIIATDAMANQIFEKEDRTPGRRKRRKDSTPKSSPRAET